MAQKILNRLWIDAQTRLAGGVNSPVRAFKAVGGTPVFIKRALGPRLYDAEGRALVDFCLSWGAIILGHADERVITAIERQASLGTSYGCATEAETMLAAAIQKAFPGMERIRFTSSGTEAVMSAIRLARGVTKRERIVKFEGCYHGHADSLLVKAGSGLATFGTPDSKGIPKNLAALTSVLPYNDEAALTSFFKSNRDIACAIIEPIAGNMGVVPGRRSFLGKLRRLTRQTGALLIFDEVITGFRLTFGGAQHLLGIKPDMTVLGKIIGGGLPIGAFGGRRQIMRHLSPQGAVYQAGTLSGNPLSMAAGQAVLKQLTPGFYRNINERSERFLKEFRRVLLKKKRAVSVSAAGSMFTPFFRKTAPKNFIEAAESDRTAFRRFFHGMLAQGVYFPPSAFEASFLSQSHGENELEKVIRACYHIR